MNQNKNRDVLLLVLGAALIGACVGLAHFAPETFERGSLQMRVLTALGGGLLGTAIPGLVGIEFKGVRAVGAAGFVVIFFLLSPSSPDTTAAAEPGEETAGRSAEPPARPSDTPAGERGGNTYENSPHTEGDGAKVNVTYDQRTGDPQP